MDGKVLHRFEPNPPTVKFKDAARELRIHGSDPTWWRKRLMTHVIGRFFQLIGGDTGQPVVELDWDNLLVLDGCRYDLFEAVYEESGLPGRLSVRKSVATGTPGFLRENFGERQYHDTVYVTGNPYVYTELNANTFHAVDHVWADRWDDELQTVRPEVIRNAAEHVAKDYPDKRLVVHFMQPHAPFIGEDRLVGEARRSTFSIREWALGNESATRSGYLTPFERLERGRVSRAELWRAYRSNLEHAWPHVEALLGSLEGLTAVTADHGNALGEFATPFPIRVYGHPLGIAIPALTNVPWLVNENGRRKRVTSEPPGPAPEVTADTRSRLEQLGYVE